MTDQTKPNLADILVLALEADDAKEAVALIRRASPDIARKTSESLKGPAVLKLVGYLVADFSNNPGKSGVVVDWLLWLVSSHVSYISSTSSGIRCLSELQRLLQLHASQLQTLMSTKRATLGYLKKVEDLSRTHASESPMQLVGVTTPDGSSNPSVSLK